MIEELNYWSFALADAHPWLLPLCLGLFGLSIGSYLNVVIYRLPLGMSTGEPRRSFCPRCQAAIAWYHNLPVLSWLLLRGRSACCKQPISVRYLLVELLTCALFVWVAYEYAFENVLTQVAFCVWVACAIACFFIDWEKMIVLPSLAFMAAGAGVLAALVSPWLISQQMSFEPLEGLAWSLAGAGFGFVLFKAIALLGRGLFGRKKHVYAKSATWTMGENEEKDDIVFCIDGKKLLWSEIFMEAADQFVLHEAEIRLEGKNEPLCASGTIRFSAERVLLPDGRSFPLEDYTSATGHCRAWQMNRAAMGSGDAYIALAIGACMGWQGLLFSLVVGSLLGIAAALVARIGRGTPMPFGPCLIGAAMIWLLAAYQWDFNYWS